MAGFVGEQWSITSFSEGMGRHAGESFVAIVSPELLDAGPPVITFVGAAPTSPNDPVVFDATDPDNQLVFVSAVVRSTSKGLAEAALSWRSGETVWGPLYATSTIAAIANGIRVTLRRTGGWPAADTRVRASAVDFG